MPRKFARAPREADRKRIGGIRAHRKIAYMHAQIIALGLLRKNNSTLEVYLLL